MNKQMQTPIVKDFKETSLFTKEWNNCYSEFIYILFPL